MTLNPAKIEDDPDAAKGAVENDKPNEPTNTTMSGQLPHKNKSPLAGTSDSDFPEPGMNEEHTGEKQGKSEVGDRQKQSKAQDQNANPEAAQQDQDPGQRQKENQNKKKDDDLAA